MFRLITTVFFVTTTLGTTVSNEHRESPIVEAHFPVDPWGISDWVLGVTMGVYGPLTARARGDDCFSAWYTWGVSSIELSNFFNKAFDINSYSDWLGLFIKLLFYGYDTYNVPAICVPELDWNKKNPWHQNYGFLAKNIPIVKGMNNDEIEWTVVMCFKLALGVLATYTYWMSEFYYWGLGYSMGGLAANIFVATDYWGDYDIIHPTPARIRYLDD